jgi:membrane-bound ClpP family serine protease
MTAHSGKGESFSSPYHTTRHLENLIIILIIIFLTFEVIEHLAFPLIWSLIHRKKKSSYGPGRILKEVGEVKQWQEKEGHVFVGGELWKAVSEVPLNTGDKVAIQRIEGLTLTVNLLNPKEQSYPIQNS